MRGSDKKREMLWRTWPSTYTGGTPLVWVLTRRQWDDCFLANGPTNNLCFNITRIVERPFFEMSLWYMLQEYSNMKNNQKYFFPQGEIEFDYIRQMFLVTSLLYSILPIALVLTPASLPPLPDLLLYFSYSVLTSLSFLLTNIILFPFSQSP